jgi:hypothetical protein
LFPLLQDICIDHSFKPEHPHDAQLLLKWLKFRKSAGAVPLISLDASMTLATLMELHSLWGADITHLTLRNDLETINYEWFPVIVAFENLQSLTIPCLDDRGRLRQYITKLQHLRHFDISFPDRQHYLLPSIVSAIKSMPSMETFKW